MDPHESQSANNPAVTITEPISASYTTSQTNDGYFSSIGSVTSPGAPPPLSTPSPSNENSLTSEQFARSVDAESRKFTLKESLTNFNSFSRSKSNTTRKGPPARLDLTNPTDSESHGLQTPRSAKLNYFPSASIKDIDRVGERPPMTAVDPSRFRSPSLPINSLRQDIILPHAVLPIKAETLNKIITESLESVLLVDIRPFSQYMASRVKSSVSICLPSTLLKRATFGLGRFAECMIPSQRHCMEKLSRFSKIIIYDQSTKDMTAAGLSPLYFTVTKFAQSSYATNDGEPGKLFYLQGGFIGLSLTYPSLLTDAELGYKAIFSDGDNDTGSISGQRSSSAASNYTNETSSIERPLALPQVLTGFNISPNAGKDGPVQAFSSNIRAYMETFNFPDDGSPLPICEGVTRTQIQNSDSLPKWLKSVFDATSGASVVANKFYDIEQTEKNRLQAAFSKDRAFDSERSVDISTPLENSYSISAGLELGIKNRYNNVWPYDHNRVRVDNKSSGNDYINASYVSMKKSKQRFIATQGPLPETYNDFWNMVWKHRIPVIVMLTVENEGGQLKCHKYWEEGKMGDLRLRMRNVTELPLSLQEDYASRSTSSINENLNVITLREFLLSDSNGNQHKVSQLQYKSWPDMGAPASPRDLIALCQLKNKLLNDWLKSCPDYNSRDMPISIVHCSAGCGRTGTFCTVDTVMDILSRLPFDDNEDLVYETVHALRRQRISMVQSLPQFTLCYETILLWHYLTRRI